MLAAADVSFIGAFLAGLVSFLSPCVLPLVPGYLSLMTGISVADLEKGVQARRVLPPTLTFIGGFTVVFVSLGATASAAGRYFLEHRLLFNRISGSVVIGFGLFLLAGMVLRFPFLFREARFHPVVNEMGVFAAPVMGAAFAFGWTPCVGPVLGTLLTLGATRGTVPKGMALLAFYSFGLGIPFVATSLGLGKLTGVLRWFRRRARLVMAVSGVSLMGFGLLLFTDRLVRVSGFLLDLFESVGLDRLSRS